VRSRYLISAAVLVAAACIGRRREAPHPAEAAAPARDDAPAPVAPAAAAPAPVEPPVAAAPAPAVEEPVAAAPAPPLEEPVAAAPAPPVEEPVAADEPVVEDEPAVAERGRFALGGSALAPGHIAVAGITFSSRREAPVGADALRLRIERALNVPDGGLIVLADPGFAPDAEGFTLALAAAAAGGFAAAGTYELLADPNHATTSASTGGSDR
jgi:hypothetical protein